MDHQQASIVSIIGEQLTTGPPFSDLTPILRNLDPRLRNLEVEAVLESDGCRCISNT